MRRAVVALVLMIAANARAAGQSNPAFVGIEMDTSSAPGCLITSVINAGPAQVAGLLCHDLILAIAGAPTANCNVLVAQIIEHNPGESVRLDVQRGATRVAIELALSTRAEVLHRRYVGHAIEPIELADVDDDRRTIDLAHGGRTTIVGWFQVAKCARCGSVFERVSEAVARRGHAFVTTPLVLAVTPRGVNYDVPRGANDALAVMRKEFGAGTPLAVVDSDEFASRAFDDRERIHFMVIDCRGIVRFVTPIAPDADDADAAVDELLAAAEQSEHARVSRR